jgi:hypothetical protein
MPREKGSIGLVGHNDLQVAEMLCQLFRSLKARESAFFKVTEPFDYAFCKAILFCFYVVSLFGILYDSFPGCSGHDRHFLRREIRIAKGGLKVPIMLRRPKIWMNPNRIWRNPKKGIPTEG